MELRHLKYFAAVAEELNFRRAAERMNITHPSFGTQIRQLEEELGAQLLERTTHRVTLTPAGRSFLEDCHRILRDVDHSAHKTQRISRGGIEPLSIAWVRSLSHSLLPRVLRAYRSKFPDAELRLMEMDTTLQIEALTTRRIDLGFFGVGLPVETSDLELTPVMEQKLMAVLPEDHPLGRRGQHPVKSIPLRALAGERMLIGARQRVSTYNLWLIALCQQAGFQPHQIWETGQPIVVLNNVAAGHGVTVMPAHVAKFSTPGVRFIPLAPPIPSCPYYAAYRRMNPHPSLLQFVKIAREQGNRIS